MSAETQRSRAEIRAMPVEAVAAAIKAGECDELLAGRDPGRAEEEKTFTPPGADQGAPGPTFRSASEWLASLPGGEVVLMLREGELDEILAGKVT